MADYDLALTPTVKAKIRDLVKAYEQLDKRIVAFIAKELTEGPAELEAWVLYQQTKIGQINQQLFILTNTYDFVGTDRVVDEIVRTSYLNGVRQVGSLLPSALLQAPTAMRGIQTETKALLSKARSNYQLAGNRAHRKAITEVADLVTSNNIGTRKAIRMNVTKLRKDGVPPFIDKANRQWTTRNYVDMATRTAVNRAHLRGKLDRVTELGYQLVKVPKGRTRSGLNTCDRCKPWENTILSLTDTATPPAKATLATAQAAGLFHPRCGHTVNLYDPDLE